MSQRVSVVVFLLACGFGLAVLQAVDVSRQKSDDFQRKMTIVAGEGEAARSGRLQGTRRTPFTEEELNSWFAFHGQDILPAGVTAPQVTILGGGKLSAVATVDLDAVAKRRSRGRALDPWSYLTGRLPVSASGVLHTENGFGRFELGQAAISGVPIPKALLQEMVSYYSRTADEPEGVRLDDPFPLPAGIRQIEVGRGQAVVIQ